MLIEFKQLIEFIRHFDTFGQVFQYKIPSHRIHGAHFISTK